MLDIQCGRTEEISLRKTRDTFVGRKKTLRNRDSYDRHLDDMKVVYAKDGFNFF